MSLSREEEAARFEKLVDREAVARVLGDVAKRLLERVHELVDRARERGLGSGRHVPIVRLVFCPVNVLPASTRDGA